MKKTIITLFLMLMTFSCSNEEKNDIWTKDNKAKKNILALGDSLTAWYNLKLEESYPIILQNILENKWFNYKVVNAWVSWDTSKNLLWRIHLYEDNYDIVLINIWGNDWLRWLNTNELKENILETIDHFPNSKIVLFSIDLPYNYWLKYRNSIKKVYEDISKQRDLYFYGLFFEWLDYKKHFQSDGIHLNLEGNKEVSENIFKYLLKNKLIKND